MKNCDMEDGDGHDMEDDRDTEDERDMKGSRKGRRGKHGRGMTVVVAVAPRKSKRGSRR